VNGWSPVSLGTAVGPRAMEAAAAERWDWKNGGESLFPQSPPPSEESYQLYQECNAHNFT